MEEIAELTGRAKRRIHSVPPKDEPHAERKQIAVNKPKLCQTKITAFIKIPNISKVRINREPIFSDTSRKSTSTFG